MLMTSNRRTSTRVADLSARLFLPLVVLALVGFFLPLAAPLLTAGTLTTDLPGTWNTQATSAVAAVAALLALRRVTLYPGTHAFAYILPAFSTTFGLGAALLLVSRAAYSGSMLLVGYTASVGTMFLLAYLGRRAAPMRMYVVPGGEARIMSEAPEVDWVVLTEPVVPADPNASIVADLRWEHAPGWERMLAKAAISGRPVYHVKQLHESLTGRVEIEHLSENSFGSLLPALGYRGVKRAIDVVACVLLLPVLALPLAVIALLVRLSSPGPVLFRQQRMGYQGRLFDMLKFRTMVAAPPPATDDADAHRLASITLTDDERITRIGRFLRRSRLDELPQIINVLRGEMSWIGPRPEAVSLSTWYEGELPFYTYRHIVRPGITGWAQVNQGHVAGLDDVLLKLHYDFYYIKFFSAWLDILIAIRTVRIMLTGFGAK